MQKDFLVMGRQADAIMESALLEGATQLRISSDLAVSLDEYTEAVAVTLSVIGVDLRELCLASRAAHTEDGKEGSRNIRNKLAAV